MMLFMKFKCHKDPSLRYMGLHEGENVGLSDTLLQVEEHQAIL